jgi:hypothetical protein
MSHTSDQEDTLIALVEALDARDRLHGYRLGRAEPLQTSIAARCART